MLSRMDLSSVILAAFFTWDKDTSASWHNTKRMSRSVDLEALSKYTLARWIACCKERFPRGDEITLPNTIFHNCLYVLFNRLI
ncbi:MAG: hypothetical protein J3Q66DRAFT_342953 [Benniella sp.]|nr:MAG: hypothetical protein J3Q66DRAFT_342953 [Benniella sp.]